MADAATDPRFHPAENFKFTLYGGSVTSSIALAPEESESQHDVSAEYFWSHPLWKVPISLVAQPATFEALAHSLEQETLVLSSPTQMLRHSSIEHLKKLDLAVLLPQILHRIDEYPVVWISVLGDVTGENPVPKRDWGKVRAMVEHWKAWGRSRRYID